MFLLKDLYVYLFISVEPYFLVFIKSYMENEMRLNLTLMNSCNYENNQQDALYRLIYYSKSAVHVSGDVFAHHQEHLTVVPVSGSVHPSC
jgi:hypothetical protein